VSRGGEGLAVIGQAGHFLLIVQSLNRLSSLHFVPSSPSIIHSPSSYLPRCHLALSESSPPQPTLNSYSYSRPSTHRPPSPTPPSAGASAAQGPKNGIIVF
jgi:hypothetical protein